MIEIKGLTKSFGNKIVLNDLNLTIPSHTIFGLVGINGAGKSTLLRILSNAYDKNEIVENIRKSQNYINSNKDLEILLDKCEELRGEYTDPIEVGQSLANAIYEDKSIKINQLKNLDCEKFNDWYIDGREVGNELEIEMERE